MHSARSLSVGLIGAGGMGMRHAENLHRHVGAARLAAAYDLDRGRAEQVAALCGAAVYDDPLRLIQDDRIEAVIIASPDATHAGFVQECLRWGKPVLCEKPLATSAADAARVIAAESALGSRLVSVGLMRRFDPYHVAVQQVAASRRLGRPILYKGVHRNAAIPYDVRGEVIVTNSAGHDIDAVRWLQAKGGSLRERAHEWRAKAIGFTHYAKARVESDSRLPKGLDERTVINFLNDIAALYLVKIHWDLITKRWTQAPFTYRYEWLTVFYLVFLLVRSRKQAPKK